MTETILLKEQYEAVPTADTEKGSEEIPAHFGYGFRHMQFVIYFICLTTTFIARGHLGVTIVAMTSHGNNPANKTNLNNSNLHTNDSLKQENLDGQTAVYSSYDWPKPIQEAVLSSFFLGYCLGTLPAALVCQRWGGKLPLQASLLVNGGMSLLTPWLTRWGGWKALSTCRVLQGLAQAGTYPGLQTLLAKWAPISERATMSSYVYTGSTVGSIIGFQISGILAEAWGWAVNFWTTGAICFLCFIFLTVFGSTTPQTHSTISEEEKSYILGHNDATMSTRRPAPWKAILTSGRVWANFATHIGSGTSFIFLMTQIPSFTHYILGVNVKSSGLLSSLPYLGSFFASCAFGLFSDYLTNKNFISHITARRLFNSISQVGVAVALVCASFASSTTAAVLCFTVAVSCQTGVHTGWMLNHMDLSPEFGGTLMACGNTLTNLVVLIMPVLISHIVLDVRNVYQWRILLWLVATLCFLTNVVFVIFLSADVQPWDHAGHDAAIDDEASVEDKEKTDL